LKSKVFQKLAAGNGIDQQLEEAVEEQAELDSLADLNVMAELEADEKAEMTEAVQVRSKQTQKVKQSAQKHHHHK
jgi:hypothetical protein